MRLLLLLLLFLFAALLRAELTCSGENGKSGDSKLCKAEPERVVTPAPTRGGAGKLPRAQVEEGEEHQDENSLKAVAAAAVAEAVQRQKEKKANRNGRRRNLWRRVFSRQRGSSDQGEAKGQAQARGCKSEAIR